MIAPDPTLSEVLNRLGRELARVEDMGLRLEDSVAELVSGTADAAPSSLQTLDLMVQTCRDLKCFALHMAETMPRCGAPELEESLRVVRLARVRQALSGHFADQEEERDAHIF
ncbi:hypothetical protein [Oceaniglobus roseus]|uniref:hypothetical protein n=1 Tax=Oceaniglobus roseus TaxID=1737570 RepID=UPI000C7F4802|nr:hypothetical protein [Kandeliimicrobium roseum]